MHGQTKINIFCVFVFVLRVGFKIFSVFFYILNTSLILWWSAIVYNMLLKSVVTSYYFAVLVTQTTEVKTLFFSISHNFKTDAKPCLRPSVAEFSQQRIVFEDRSFHLAFVSLKNWH